MAKISYDEQKAQKILYNKMKAQTFRQELEELPDEPGFSVSCVTFEEELIAIEINHNRKYNIEILIDEKNEFTTHVSSTGSYVYRDGEKVDMKGKPYKPSILERIFG